MTGQNGEHIELEMIGTDSSTATYNFQHVSQQTNNIVSDGELDYFFINAYPTVAAGGQLPKMEKPHGDFDISSEENV